MFNSWHVCHRLAGLSTQEVESLALKINGVMQQK